MALGIVGFHSVGSRSVLALWKSAGIRALRVFMLLSLSLGWFVVDDWWFAGGGVVPVEVIGAVVAREIESGFLESI